MDIWKRQPDSRIKNSFPGQGRRGVQTGKGAIDWKGVQTRRGLQAGKGV